MGSQFQENFEQLTGPQLLDAYNAMAGTIGHRPRTCRFRSREEGIRLCRAIHKRVPVLPLASAGDNPKEVISDGRVIHLLVTSNPRREGTAAHGYFEKLVNGETVGQYLSKFQTDKERRDARQWLGYSRNQGYIKLGEPA